MTVARVDALPVPTSRLVGFFLSFFCLVLAGYAIIGKGFAYLGIPPLYLGEMALVLGMASVLTAGRLSSAVLNLPGLALVLLMLWTAVRTVPYWTEYGIESLRDAMLVFYGLFAFVIASLLLRCPALLTLLIERYKRFIPLMISLAPISLALSFIYPTLPDGRPLFAIKSGDISCHFVAICAFALVGFTRLRPWALVAMLPTALVTFTQSRESIVSFAVGGCLATVLSPHRRAFRHFLILTGVLVAVVGTSAAMDVRITPLGDDRQIAVRQLVANVTSIFEHTDSAVTEGPKEWRLMWWKDIIDYTLHGPYFWTGKGFGVNLADSDGYQTSDPEKLKAPLRSPHNAHMTILARAGVPGLLLWIFMLASWLVAIARQLAEARRLNDTWWASAFAFLLCFWTVLVISSSFDVAFEGPVRGIWFWTIHGIGIATLILHRHRSMLIRTGRTPPSSAARLKPIATSGYGSG